MTLQQFITATAGMPAATELKILSPWGDFEPVAIATIEDLFPGDPLIEDFPSDAIVITSDADHQVNASIL